MSNRNRFPYLIALVSVAVTAGIRVAVDPWFGERAPLALFTAAVACTAVLAGSRPAIFASVLGYMVGVFLFVFPRGTMGVANWAREGAIIVVYVAACSAIIIAAERWLHHQRMGPGRRSSQGTGGRFRSPPREAHLVCGVDSGGGISARVAAAAKHAGAWRPHLHAAQSPHRQVPRHHRTARATGLQ